MIEAIILTISPLLVDWGVKGVKKIKSVELSKKKKLYLRLVNAVLSLILVIGVTWASDAPVDIANVSEKIESLIKFVYIFLGTEGIYSLKKKS